jgi:Complex I intermediate-associated protein 30 (CIA30).
MKNRIGKWVGVLVFAALLLAWWFEYSKCGEADIELFPHKTFEIFPLNDSAVGGFSTSEVQATDTLLTASVNIHSGKAFTFAGIGFKLKSLEKRLEPFDLTNFDSLEVRVASKRMNSMKLRILTEDPVYTRKGDYATYRVLEKDIPSAPYLLMGGAKERFAVSKFAVSEFRVPEWWLSSVGLENDDGKTYLNSAKFFEIVSGSSTLRGIPDEMEIRYVRLWSDKTQQKKELYMYLASILFGLVLFLVYVLKTSGGKNAEKLDA